MNDIDRLLVALRAAKEAGVTQIVVDDGTTQYLEDLALASTEVTNAPNGDKILVIERERDRSSPFEMIDGQIIAVGDSISRTDSITQHGDPDDEKTANGQLNHLK